MLLFRKNVVAGAGNQCCELSQAVELAVGLPEVPVHDIWASCRDNASAITLDAPGICLITTV